ncbi:transcobalamin-1-like, partial [Hypanus sabinus]|uniref:transcobalamin-1-like n=1 Tax=Hypanus sabinus TaxID=79690 RepID=UPI0028C3E3F7
IPEARRETLDSLLRTMLYSVGDPNRDPNPSILIALRLARDHHLETERRLTEQLREAAAQKLDRREDFTSGLLALYTLALTSACHNPEHLEVQGKTFNLLQVLEEKLNQEIEHIDSESVPLSNYFQVSLDVLSLCVHHHPLTADMVRVLTDAVEGDRFTHGGGVLCR